MSNICKSFQLYSFIRKLSTISSSNIEDSQLMYELHRSKIFIIGFFLRIFLIFSCEPLIQKIWFIEFIKNSLKSIEFNPWQAHLVNGGDVLAFPYGYVMYLAYFPLTTIGLFIDKYFDLFYFSKIGFGLTSLIFDYGILISISLLLKKYSPKLLLLAYWFSPLVIYIFYWHGQLDALPVCFLVWSIAKLQAGKTKIAAVLLGMALSAKLSMLVAIPFIFIYLYRNKRLSTRLPTFLGYISLTYFISIVPFVGSEYFQSMVLKTPETGRLFSVYLNYGYDLKLFLLPIAYFVTLYLIWRLERITLDLFLISVGVGFFALLLLLPPAPGWFAWVIPFLVFYQLRSHDYYLLTSVPFFIFYLIFNLLYSTGADIFLLNAETSKPLVDFLQFEDLKFKSLIFTALQASGLIVCVRMYLFGILRNNYYRGFKNKFGIGISGYVPKNLEDLLNSLKNSFGSKSISSLDVADYYKWDKNHPIRSTNNFLLPNSYNLSRLTKDYFFLKGGRSIWQNSNILNRDFIGSPKKIQSRDYICVTGVHSFTIKRLRDKLNLKIFIEIEENLKEYFFNENDLQKLNFFNQKCQIKDYVINQIKYSDLSFKFAAVNSVSLKNAKNKAEIPKLKLYVTMENGFFHEELSRSLIGLCTMHIDVEQTSDLENITLCIEGEATKEDVEQIANILIPNIDDIVTYEPKWEEGYQGLMQVITLVHISNILYQEGAARRDA